MRILLQKQIFLIIAIVSIELRMRFYFDRNITTIIMVK